MSGTRLSYRIIGHRGRGVNHKNNGKFLNFQHGRLGEIKIQNADL